MGVPLKERLKKRRKLIPRKRLLRRSLESEEWRRIKRIYKEATPVVLITVVMEIVAGLELLRVSKYYVLLPGLLLIIPGLMEARGNVVTSLAQRLGSSAHLGLINWDLGINDEVKVNWIATIILSSMLSFILSVLAYVTAVITKAPHMAFWGFLSIALLMTLIVGTTLASLTVLVVLLAHRFGLDPDNVTIPIVATLGDIFAVGSLYIIIRIVLYMSNFISIV